jgi:very-short-patch-repair endonuclease
MLSRPTAGLAAERDCVRQSTTVTHPIGMMVCMSARLDAIAAAAAANHGVVSRPELGQLGVDASLRLKWVRAGRLVELGERSYALPGAPATWKRALAAGLADVGTCGVIAGRSAARLHGLDGFHSDVVEILVPRRSRNLTSRSGTVCSTALEIGPLDTTTIEGLRVLRAERLILDGPLFDFDRAEIENAIDSAIRQRLVSEQRLRTRVVDRHRRGINGGRILLDALIDTGGESRLERMFLRLVRLGKLDRPTVQRNYRSGSTVLARVDFEFTGGLIVEVSGFGYHSTRQQLQHDGARQTELMLLGRRVLTFTYDDVRYRPDWVLERLARAMSMGLAA